MSYLAAAKKGMNNPDPTPTAVKPTTKDKTLDYCTCCGVILTKHTISYNYVDICEDCEYETNNACTDE